MRFKPTTTFSNTLLIASFFLLLSSRAQAQTFTKVTDNFNSIGSSYLAPTLIDL